MSTEPHWAPAHYGNWRSWSFGSRSTERRPHFFNGKETASMCRHFAWLGRPRTLAELILQPSYGLPRQAARPRWQNIELVNRDGFGTGWFPAGEPGRAVTYRRAVPYERDEGFATLAEKVSA